MSVVDARDTSQPDYAVKLKQVCDELRMLKRYIVGSDDLDKLFQLPSVVDTATAHKFLRLSLDRTALEWSSPIADELDIACATLNVADYIAVGTATGSTQEWGTLYAALDMGQAGAVAADNSGLSLYLASNCYRTNTGWKYKTAGTASLIQLVGSVITVKQAVAGVADAAVTFTPALEVDAAGNVGVGATPVSKLTVAGDIRALSGGKLILNNPSNASGATLSYTSDDTVVLTSSGDVARLAVTSDSKLGLGTTVPTTTIDAVDTGAYAATRIHANSPAGEALQQVVAGNGTVSSDFAYTYYLASKTIPYSWKAGLHGNNNYTIRDETAGANRLVINNSGYIGIGLESANRPITIYNTEAQIQFVNGNTGSTVSDGLRIGLGGASSVDAYIDQLENAPLIFAVNTVECARYTASGQFQQQCATAAVGTYLKNTSAAGLGLRTDGGSAGNYSLSVRNYAGTELFQVSGAGDALATGNGGLGYGAGSGGTVTQLTSKSTGVTLNRASGQITLNNAALAANTTVSFAVACNVLGPNDVVVLNLRSGYATNATYQAWINDVSAGQFVVNLRNVSAGSLSEAVVLSYAIIRGSAT